MMCFVCVIFMIFCSWVDLFEFGIWFSFCLGSVYCVVFEVMWKL